MTPQERAEAAEAARRLRELIRDLYALGWRVALEDAEVTAWGDNQRRHEPTHVRVFREDEV
jgi:hypothetical protein